MPPSLQITDPTVLVIFGAGGDLTWRKLVPAIYRLFAEGSFAAPFAVLGLDRKGRSSEAWAEHLKQGVQEFADPEAKSWAELAPRLQHVGADFDDPASYQELSRRIEALEAEWGMPANRVFYLAIPPGLIGTLVQHLGESQLAHGPRATRVVIEKPFGRDLASARQLDGVLRSVFEEKQIFRIDHYLGKETVQNLLAFRFANALFEPIWNQHYIHEVQITVGETVGVEHRGPYYEKAGALRDMIQNHLLQLVCLVAMEPPVKFAAEEIRDRKVDVLRAIRPIPPERVGEYAVRGQYGSGWIEGERVAAYRDEPRVDRNSMTETFAALRLYVDNWRWSGVPFWLRTGKRLPARVSEISVVFRQVPHQAFPRSAAADMRPNRLVIRIQPDEGIVLLFHAKQPGLGMRLVPVNMHFTYRETFSTPPPDAYETLLSDVMRGDATLFMRADQVEAAWSVVDPVLQAWQSEPADFPSYAAGTWGPEAATSFVAREGTSWLLPTLTDGGHD
jgi:glucose-6-phosphate 1-dehydrogenase